MMFIRIGKMHEWNQVVLNFTSGWK